MSDDITIEKPHKKSETGPKDLRKRALTAEKKLRELKAEERMKDNHRRYEEHRDWYQSRGFPQTLIDAAMRADFGYDEVDSLPCTIGLTSGTVLTGHPTFLPWWRRSHKQNPVWITLTRITFQHPPTLRDIEKWDIEINTAQIAWVAWSKSLTKWVEDDHNRGPLELPTFGTPQQPQPPDSIVRLDACCFKNV